MNEPALFDYTALDDVRQLTDEIRDRVKRTARDIIEIGERLITVKERLGHGRFGEWLRAEFDWSHDTANNLMNVAKAFKIGKFPNLDISPSALYALSAPSVPETIREQAVALSANGHQVTFTEARNLIEAARLSPSRQQLPDQAAFDGFDETGPDTTDDYFTCDCGEIFSEPVWHCPGCHHHWLVGKDLCTNCHEFEWHEDGTIHRVEHEADGEDEDDPLEEPDPLPPPVGPHDVGDGRHYNPDGGAAFPPVAGRRKSTAGWDGTICDLLKAIQFVREQGGIAGSVHGWTRHERCRLAERLEGSLRLLTESIPTWIAHLRSDDDP